jgi:RNA-binding protein YhbY
VATETREERAGIVAEIADQTNSCMCGATGATACFYRPSKQKLIDLSKEQ